MSYLQDDEEEPVATLSHAEPSSLDLLPDPDVLYPKRARRSAKSSSSDSGDNDEDENAVDGGSSGETESEEEATDGARGQLAGDEAAGMSDSDHVDSGESVEDDDDAEEEEVALPRPVRQPGRVPGKQPPARGRHNLQRDQLLALALLRRTPPSSASNSKLNKSNNRVPLTPTSSPRASS